LEADISKNASELHCKQLCFEMEKSGKCTQNFFINLASGEFPKCVWTCYVLWLENGFNRENMSRTSLKKYLNWVLWNFIHWRKLRPKNASADFQNFCRLASKAGAESAGLFGSEGTLPHLYGQEWKRPTPVQRQLSQTQALLRRVYPGCVWTSIWNSNAESCGVIRPLCVPLMIRPLHVCCCCQKNWWAVVQRVQWVSRF